MGRIFDDFGLRIPVIQKKIRQKKVYLYRSTHPIHNMKSSISQLECIFIFYNKTQFRRKSKEWWGTNFLGTSEAKTDEKSSRLQHRPQEAIRAVDVGDALELRRRKL